MQKGTKDKIILHEAGEKTCKIPVRLREIINIKPKNSRNDRFRIIMYCCLKTKIKISLKLLILPIM